MCRLCEEQGASRRRFLRAAAAGVAGAAFGGAMPAFAGGGHKTTLGADEALARLIAGNQKYLGSPNLCASQLAAQRGGVAVAQTPWATILSCADSRVPPELVFGGLGHGELFVARNAGNMVDTATMGTIEYGASALGVPLIVVLGHERCGAVKAACEAVEKQTKFPASIGPMVDAIVPAARAVLGQPGDWVENVVRESARRTAHKIATESSIVAELVQQGKVKVVAGRYDLDEGKVEFFV